MANYTTMLLREDLGMLLVGARGAIYALDLKDISKKRASVRSPHILKQKQIAAFILLLLIKSPSLYDKMFDL